MPDLKTCLCKTCQLRQCFARAFDMHFWGEDCPYQCDMYDDYRCRVGEEDDHSICGATNLPCIRCNPGGCDNRKEGAD